MTAKRVFIGIYGKRNKGKSSLINAIANQEIAIVSDIAGTTTDPVKKSIEIFGIGPVVFVDTAGIDDEGILGEKRVQKTIASIQTVDVAILLVDNDFGDAEKQIIEQFKLYDIPFLIVLNKSDLQTVENSVYQQIEYYQVPIVECSTKTKEGIQNVIDTLVKLTPPSAYLHQSLLEGIVQENDCVVLVMPQDSEAPEGRLILPQVQVIRDLLDNYAIAISLQVNQLSYYLSLNTPQLIITDSQAFEEVAQLVPKNISLTSFSIVLARAKGNFENFLKGTSFIEQLQDGDSVLMLESCTHVTSCEDIGRHKIPYLLQKFTGKKLNFIFVSALSPLPDLENIKMGIQCGGCMVTQKQLLARMKQLIMHNIPISNYGMTIAYITGIFDRVTKLFENLK